MKKIDYQKLIEYLSLILRCPVCSNKYSSERTNVIETKENKKNGESMLVHAECATCHSSIVFNIAVEGKDIFSIGMVTDLDAEDAKRFRISGPISSEEVLKFYSFMENFDGDFETILKQKPA